MRQNINIMVQKADREKSAVSTAALLSAELDINNILTAKGCPKFKKKKIFFKLKPLVLMSRTRTHLDRFDSLLRLERQAQDGQLC